MPRHKNYPKPLKKRPEDENAFNKGDQAKLREEIILRDGPTLPYDAPVIVLAVDTIGKAYQYLIEEIETGITAWVLECELRA